MRIRIPLQYLTLLIFSPFFSSGCTLSNSVEDIKVLCGLKDVNPEIDYVRLLSPGLSPLSEEDRARTTAEFIHTGGRIETLSLTNAGCLSLPKAEGQLSVRVLSGREWVAYETGLKADRAARVRDLTLSERGRLNAEWPCPAQGFLANDELASQLEIKDASSNLQNLQLRMTVTDKNGKDLGSLYSKDFGQKVLDLPSRLSLKTLSEGEYTLNLAVRDSFFGNSAKANLVASQCPLEIKRSCSSAGDRFDPETVSCRPLLCDDKYRVGEFWTETLPNKKGSALYTCRVEAGEPMKVATDASCDAGYFESRANCVGATRVAAGLNHSCAVLENGDVSCWGYNVFDTLGPSDTVGSSGKALGPQPPLALSEAAVSVAVSSVSSCALLASGRVQCWGYLPNTLDADGFVQYEVKGTPEFVKRADGTDLQDVSALVVGGGPDHDTYCVVTGKKEALCWGKDLLSRRQALQFGNWLYPSPIFQGRSVAQLAVTDREICGLDTNGAVFCQGSALGSDLTAILPDAPAEIIPVVLPAPAIAISSQSIGKCAILVDERLYCWGLRTDRNQNLEWNFAHGRPDIPRTMTIPEENKTFFEQTREVGLNGEIQCVLKKDGQPLCQLGPNAYENERVNNVFINLRPPRLQVKAIQKENGEALRGIKTMALGFWHGCGVQENGQVSCWGNNQFGRLGNGTVGGSGLGEGIPDEIFSTLIQAP